jgi:ornithine cyclodeaminase/alanine dehydrogenase-like protein (mu-crystallin family)
VLARSQLVVTATSARRPVLPDDPALLAGKTYIAIGSYMPDMRELPDALWQVARTVYTELPFACEESGDLSQPLASGMLTKERIIYMGDHLARKAPPPAAGETVCFKSVGVGLFDLICAQAIYVKARELGVGQELH